MTFLIQVNTKRVFTPKTTVPWLTFFCLESNLNLGIPPMAEFEPRGQIFSQTPTSLQTRNILIPSLEEPFYGIFGQN